MSGRETGIHAHGWVCAQLELQPDLSPDGRPGLSGSAGCQCSTGGQGQRMPPRAGPRAARRLLRRSSISRFGSLKAACALLSRLGAAPFRVIALWSSEHVG